MIYTTIPAVLEVLIKNNLIRSMQKVHNKYIPVYIREELGNDNFLSITEDYACSLFSSLVVGIISVWIHHDKRETPERNCIICCIPICILWHGSAKHLQSSLPGNGLQQVSLKIIGGLKMQIRHGYFIPQDQDLGREFLIRIPELKQVLKNMAPPASPWSGLLRPVSASGFPPG